MSAQDSQAAPASLRASPKAPTAPPTTTAPAAPPTTTAPAAPPTTTGLAAPTAPAAGPTTTAPGSKAPNGGAPRRLPRSPSKAAHRSRGRGRPLASRSASSGLRGLSSGSLPTAVPAAGKQPASSHRGRAARKRAQQPSRLPPVVRTITRIVSVVPLPLRIAIGALIALAAALAARSRIAAARARRLERQRKDLLDDVGVLQAALLPISPERLGPVDASTAYRPAGGPAAGGDFYDLFALEDGQIAVIVGDVSGHGRQALPHTALLRFTLRAYLEAGFSPQEALRTAGAALERQLGDSFATVALAIYQPRARTLTYACAGHPPPLLVASAPFDPVTACSAPPIGAGMRTGTRQTTLALPGATLVCLYTDGVTEARLGAELYGNERLRGALAELGAGARASDLLDRVAQQTDQRPDDMAACLLSIAGGAEPPRVLVEELQLDAERAGVARVAQFLVACGVRQVQVEGVLKAVRAEALRSGSAVLQVRPASGAADDPQVSVRPNNLARLDRAKVSRALVGAQ